MFELKKILLNVTDTLNKGGDFGYIKAISMGNNIPKVIHQTYHNKDLPLALKKNVDKLKLDNPDWEYRLYDDKDISEYISKFYPSLTQLYNKINPKYGAAKADLFRYLLMYREGGVYLDIKSGLKKPLNYIINSDDQYILSHWTQYNKSYALGHYRGITNPNGELQQWHIITTQGHPFLKAVIENVCRNIEKYNPVFNGYGKMGVLNVTGPIAYTQTISRLLSQYPHRLELSHEDAGLIYNVLGSHEGHHEIFKKTHYTKLEEPVINQGFFINSIFYCTIPLLKSFKLVLKRF